jgi:hypothetical protein
MQKNMSESLMKLTLVSEIPFAQLLLALNRICKFKITSISFTFSLSPPFPHLSHTFTHTFFIYHSYFLSLSLFLIFYHLLWFSKPHTFFVFYHVSPSYYSPFVYLSIALFHSKTTSIRLLGILPVI